MARIDDYRTARNLAVEALSTRSPADIADTSGFTADPSGTLRIPFLDRVYRVTYPDFSFVDTSDSSREVPLQEQVLILHYLDSGPVQQVKPRWIAYREIPGASFYFSAFVKRAVDPLKKVFGQNAAAFISVADRLGGKPVDAGDAAREFRLFPRVPVQLIIWEGDDEFPPEANILFDVSIGGILSPEDTAWLAGMLVYRLIAGLKK